MKKLNVFFVILIIGISACTIKENVKIIETNFSEVIQEQQSLKFTFNQDLFPDSLLNQWDTIQYLVFEPPVQGKFKRISKNELLFSPSLKFLPSTDYKVSLTNNLLAFSPEDYGISTEEIKFHTLYLEMEYVNAFWAINRDNPNDIEVRLQVGFNQQVEPEDLKKLLTVSINGKSVEPTPVTLNPSHKIEFRIADPGVEPDKVIPVKIKIEKGLSCFNSDWLTTKRISNQVDLPPRDILMVREMIPHFESGEGAIIIRTSQPLGSANIKNYITIDPELDFEAELLDDGIKLKGAFVEGNTYQIRVSGKIKGVFGNEMGDAYSQMVSFGKVDPYIAFTDKSGVYLTSKGSRNLGLKIVSIPDLKISVFKVYENNILHYLREGQSWDWMYRDGRYWDLYGYDFNQNFGQVIFTKEIRTVDLPKKGNLQLLNIDPAEIGINDSRTGMFVVMAESAEKNWLRDVQLLSLSDIGMIVKTGTDDIHVFVNSIKDATPIQGVNVGFVSQNNQVVYNTTTNNEGIAVLRDVKSIIPGFDIAMITAARADDFNFIVLDQNRVEASRFDVGGKIIGDSNYDVFIYGDRDIYRPGDSVFFNSIVRTPGWKVVDDMPVKLKVVQPDGRVFTSFKINLNSQGAAESAFYLPDACMTGMYSIEVYSGNDVLIGSSIIRVEEFMPDRIKVRVNTNATEYEPRSVVEVTVNVMNLFGPPAEDRNYELEQQISRKGFYPKGLEDYGFGIELIENRYFESEIKEGKTDSEGNAEVSFVVENYQDIGILQGKIFTTVFDETGRPVNRINKFDIFTQDVFYGIKHFDYWLDTRKQVRFNFLAVDKQASILNNVPARVEIVHYTWESVLERSGNSYVYRSEKRENLVFADDITIKGNLTNIDFTPLYSGSYEVRIMPEKGSNWVAQRFYAYGWGDTDYSSFEISKEGETIIEADKEQYSPGDKAILLFKAPFNGKLLVTLERSNVLEHYYLDLNDKSASLSLKIKEDHLPNIYVSATAIRKTGMDDLPLTVAHGFKSLKVDKALNRLEVEIDAVEKSRSKTKQTIKINTTPGAQVTIAVVDEGILQVTDYKTPDPYDYFYQKRALEVLPYDIYASLYPDLKANESSYAGGLGAELGKRINPLKSKRVKLMARWSGIRVADNNGVCIYEVDIPQFSGALRIMAVAYKDNKFAGLDKMMTVADPVVISTALPRFLSPGDLVTMPVTVTNTTNKSVEGKVLVKPDGPLVVIGEESQFLDLEKNSETSVVFTLEAQKRIGVAEVEVEMDAMKETFTEEIEIPVRPPTGLIKLSSAGSVKGKDTATFKVSTDFIPETVKSRLVLSKSPIVEFTKNLQYLLGYPYGCLEQTVSKAFPLIYYNELAEALEQQDVGIRYNPAFSVNEAIKKIYSMQQYHGGLLYWPGGGSVSWWGSIFAAHFLYEAELSGYDVDQKVFEKLINYIKSEAKEKESEEYFYRRPSGAMTTFKHTKREVAYSLFVMALVNQPNLSLMNYYKSNLELLTDDSRYLLAGAYRMIGDVESSEIVLPEKFGENRAIRSFGGSFSSYTRDMAISLYVLVKTDPENNQIPVLAKALSKDMKNRRWLSTQESVFSLMALGKIARSAAESNIEAAVEIDGELIGEFFGDKLVLDQDINNRNILIETRNEGMLYYFYEVEGISETGNVPETDNNLEVRKKFYNRFGQLLTTNNYNQNDLVVVKVSIRTTLGRYIENVAITDILPACFEIENPRLSPNREMQWIDDKSTPEYMDVRDDRISFFTTARSEWKHFYYMARVVSQGTYKMGPVSADAMYDGQYNSVSGAAIIIAK